MTNSLATLAVALLLSGTTIAQQQPRRATNSQKTPNGTTGTITPNDAARSTTSSANTHDGTNGASTGTGLTLDQYQANSQSNKGTTKVDANSSVRTGPSDVKARKKSPKMSNQSSQ
ncbi:hypothetical protein [Spirosoma koreense]